MTPAEEIDKLCVRGPQGNSPTTGDRVLALVHDATDEPGIVGTGRFAIAFPAALGLPGIRIWVRN
ncbi:hypothetical protein [Streptomyces sp. CB02414]|uniref:hypothetical protein n=1 Tax=Streptomyces sp. CB02414 TaxID=1703922 RepID=UPI0011614B1E|nr:hypothetical protein [Streptomyces sp. CB02414]